MKSDRKEGLAAMINNIKSFYVSYRSLKQANYLFQCGSEDCGLYVRYYQANLNYAIKGTFSCPHCGQIADHNDENILKILWEGYDDYIDHSLEAPKLNLLEWFKIYKYIKLIDENRQDQIDIEKYLSFIKKREAEPRKQMQWIAKDTHFDHKTQQHKVCDAKRREVFTN